MEKVAVLSFIIGVICLLVAVPALVVGLFVGPQILITALCCAALGIGLLFFARTMSERKDGQRRQSKSLSTTD